MVYLSAYWACNMHFISNLERISLIYMCIYIWLSLFFTAFVVFIRDIVSVNTNQILNGTGQSTKLEYSGFL